MVTADNPSPAIRKARLLQSINELILLRWLAVYSEHRFGDPEAHLDRIDELLDERNELTKKPVDTLATSAA